MKKLFIRLTILIIVFGAGWLIYSASGHINCTGPKPEAWFIATKARLDDALSDENASEVLIQELYVPTPTPAPLLPGQLPQIGTTENTSVQDKKSQDRLKTLAANASTRYIDQQSQETPTCLSKLQDKVITAFYYDWKYYLAATEGNKELISKYADEFNNARDNVIIELDKLSIKYNQ